MPDQSFDQDAWLRRIGHAGSRTPTLETLRAVVDVPVESLDERFTTTLATQTPARASAEDARAAAHLLTTYLARESGSRR